MGDIFHDRFFGFYRDIGAVLYPVLSDVVEVERNLHRLLRNRAQAGGGYRPDANGLVKPFGMSLGFLSLLFAILASGCQLSDLPTSERELTSWVYGLWSFLSVCLCLELMKLTVCSSLLFLPVSADDELCRATHGRSHTDSIDYKQCFVL